MNPMERLHRIGRKPQRMVVGLMSGTSHDGVDAALVQISGSGPGLTARLLQHTHVPYISEQREAIAEAFHGSTQEVCRINSALGEWFAEAVLACLREAGTPVDQVDAVGSHGQTLYHIPPAKGTTGATLQVGEPAVIAERTGLPVVSNFRARDLAAGGQGAPLVAYVDYLMFREPGRVTAVQNLGGIANVTVVPEEQDSVLAFDTGPGNALLDEAVKILSDGREAMDDGGSWAAQGTPDEVLLSRLLSHSYLALPPPKSTGREMFGKTMVEALLSENPDLSPEDFLCTLTHFTARTIRLAYEAFVFPKFAVDQVVLSGGGSHNLLLRSLLDEEFSGIPLVSCADMGIPVEAKEAMGFAILASETLAGRTGNLPTATGARHPVILGSIVP